MGIQGLEILMKKPGFLEDIELHDSLMIIDGSSLYYCLYYQSNPKLDQSHGGDYSGFKTEVCQFFQVLTECNIYPLVVLDGGSDHEKHKTLKDRLQCKIGKAKKIAKGEQQRRDNKLPPLIKEIFKQILIAEEVSFLQSFGEADVDVVCFANKFDCPVLSNDSDFYIYDLKGGVFSLYSKNFQWKTPREGKIPAKHYRRSQFCIQINIDAALIPVFASIAGNDYSSLEDRGKFVERHPQWIQEVPTVERLQAILIFLRGLDLSHAESTEQKQNQAVTQALQMVGEEDQDRLQTSINTLQRSINKYNIRSKLTPPQPDLPEWMHELIRKGRLNTFVIDVICQKKMMLTPLVDDFSQPSSYSAAGRIRQFFYGLLIGQEMCTEFDRDGETVRQQKIKPLLPKVSEEELINLHQRGPVGAPEGLCLRVFLEALDAETFDFGDIPDEMKLPLCVTNFWWRYRQQNHHFSPNTNYLQALLLWFMCGKGCGPDGSKVKDKPEPDVAHAFNQWQCCFIASLHLNQLLGRPLPEPDCAWIYHGPVIHQLVDELHRGSSPEQLAQLGLRTEQQQQLFRNFKTKCGCLEA